MPIDEKAALMAERASMLATLRSLDDADWDQPSLCAGWRVRDVAAHNHLVVTLRPLPLVWGLVRARGDFNAFMAGYAAEIGSRPVAEILDDFARFAATAKTPPGIRRADQAVDVFVHHHDVAIPLGREVPTDPARLRWMADAMVGANKLIGSAKRTEGLRLVATDIDWHHGTGPEIHGPAAALILAGCGRTALHDQLEGEGLEVLARRS